MAIPSRGIGWSTEDNLLWQISKQLERLTQVTGNSVSTTSTTTTLPPYKVYTALLTQSGGDNFIAINSGDLTIGVTYQIIESGPYSGIDFTNVGAPNNNFDTYFIATGTTPNNWGGASLAYNTGAPVATVLENTIGNVWFTYNNVGTYYVNANNLFTSYKTTINISNPTWDGGNGFIQSGVDGGMTDHLIISTRNFSLELLDLGLLSNTQIEIRVYN